MDSSMTIILVLMAVVQIIIILSIVKIAEKTKEIANHLYKTNELLDEILKNQKIN
ncbi:MAG: hypothetical protein ACI4I9_04205 [Porcipelethomonas sp.]